MFREASPIGPVPRYYTLVEPMLIRFKIKPLFFYSVALRIFGDESCVLNAEYLSLTTKEKRLKRVLPHPLAVSPRSLCSRFFGCKLLPRFPAVLLRGLDPLTSEDKVLTVLNKLNDRPIKAIRIGRDNLTNMSFGICYIDMNTLVDAISLHNTLLGQPPIIDDKLISVSYLHTKTLTPTQAANTALAAAQWSHQGKQPSEAEIESMAEYSANLYAKDPSEKLYYLEYYRNYFRHGGDQAAASTSSPSVNSSVAAISTPKPLPNLGIIKVNGVDYKIFRKFKMPLFD